MKYLYYNTTKQLIFEINNDGLCKILFKKVENRWVTEDPITTDFIPRTSVYNSLSKGCTKWKHLKQIDLEQYISEHFEEFV